jgi:hypothetical protein
VLWWFWYVAKVIGSLGDVGAGIAGVIYAEDSENVDTDLQVLGKMPLVVSEGDKHPGR